jgi:Methyltransferase domain
MVADHIAGAALKLRAARTRINDYGLERWLFEVWRRRVVLPALRWPHMPMHDHTALLALFEAKRGLEVGGPSRFFQSGQQLPLYPRIASLDNCNFANETVWEGTLAEGTFSLGDRLVGRQYLCEATAVATHLAGRSYEFVISSNCLEHVANPLAAVEAWLAVLQPGGTLLIVVPNQRSNFDHRRAVTTFDHILQDYKCGIGEDDASHFDEVIRSSDLRLMSKGHVADAAAYRRLVTNNLAMRCVHHHVFDAALLTAIAAHFRLEAARTIDVATDFVLVARKPTH